MFCLREKVKLVYLDCWFFTRTEIHLVLPFQALMKAFGVKLLYDARDPFPEYEIASRECKDGTLKTGLYRVLSRMLYKLSDIILLPVFSKYVRHSSGSTRCTSVTSWPSLTRFLT